MELTRKWVIDGEAPPRSRLPRRGDGTAVWRHQALDRWAVLTGIAAPEEADMLCQRAASGALEPTGQVYVSALDRDGNEVAGIRHPELSVPLATHTGWNLLIAQGAQWAPVGSITGNSHPFSQHVVVPGSRDQRRSIEERYHNVDDYVTQIQAASEVLVAEGFLLPEDVEHVVVAARAHFDLLAVVPTQDDRHGPPAGEP